MNQEATKNAEDLSERAYSAFCSGLITCEEFKELNQLAGLLNLTEYMLEEKKERRMPEDERGALYPGVFKTRIDT